MSVLEVSIRSDASFMNCRYHGNNLYSRRLPDKSIDSRAAIVDKGIRGFACMNRKVSPSQ